MSIDLVESRRRIWIQTLRSGELEQGLGSLIKFGYGSRNTYCCLGVALQNLTPNCNYRVGNHISYDAPEGYTDVRDGLRISMKMQQYLIALNDGCFVYLPQYSERLALVGDHTLIGDRDKIYRNTRDRRDFHFIARFLEIAWKITTSTATTVTHQNT